MQDQNGCPSNIITGWNNETESVAKAVKGVLLVAVEGDDQQDGFLQNKGCMRPGKLKNV